jgi:hypothetical protein
LVKFENKVAKAKLEQSRFGFIYFNNSYKTTDGLFALEFVMRSLILSCILTLFATNVFADDMELGRYNCIVDSTQLVTIDDGVTNKYSGYKNGISVGDILIFKILAIYLKVDGAQGFITPTTKKALQYFLLDLEGKIHDFGFLENPIFDDEDKVIVDFSGPYEVHHSIKEDDMSFNYRTLHLHRYFKTDYSLMFVQLPNYAGEQKAHVVTADCRASTHAFPAIFDYFKE